MGATIHTHIEVKKDGKWLHFCSTKCGERLCNICSNKWRTNGCFRRRVTIAYSTASIC